MVTFLAVLAGIAAFAAALKALPSIWGSLKSIGRFLAGFEKVSAVPDLLEGQHVIRDDISRVSDAVTALSDALVAHMEEEERMRSEEKSLVNKMAESVDKLAESMSRQVVDVANVVFKQAVFADPVAYYVIKYNQDTQEWDWSWGNSAYFALTGLTQGMAQGGQYWDIVAPEDRDRVRTAAEKAGEHGRPLEVDFMCVNIATGERTPVTVLAWPIHDNENDPVGYLGAVHVRHSLANTSP